jgi:hypothetical protein
MPSQFLLDSGVLDTDLLGPVVIVEASSSLGGISPIASATVTHLVTANSSLGSLTASARAADNITAAAEANLGSLDATANTRPETPSVASTGGGTPAFVQPYFPPKVEPTIEISTIIANANASLGLVKASAMSEISFSILDDDAEVLLLI